MKNVGKKGILTLLVALILTMAVPSIFPDRSTMSTVEAAKVKISDKEATMIKGQTKKLKISGTSSNVKWSSNKKSVASVNKNGKVTAKKKGNAKITATVDGKNYTCKITVENPKINKTAANISVGDILTLKIKGTIQPVIWSSSEKSIASVSSDGVVTAKAAGTATITAKVGSKKYTCNITVDADPYSILKNFLITKGTKSGSNYSYDYVDDDYILTITYSNSSNKFKFVLKDGYSVCSMSLKKNASEVTPTIKEREFDASVTLKKSSYRRETLYFTITDNTSVLPSSSWQSLANIDLRLMFSMTQVFLLNEVGISLQDLGFISYPL